MSESAGEAGEAQAQATEQGRIVAGPTAEAPSAEPKPEPPVEAPAPTGAPPVEEPEPPPPIEEPGQAPPVEEPKREEAPVEEPKHQEPPVEEPKHQEPPVEEPEHQEPPVEEPEHEEPPVEESPAPEPAAAAEPPAPEPPAPEPPPPPPAPSIKSVAPDHGPLAGGATITVSGEAFAEGCRVLIGGAEAKVTRESDTTLRVETPARSQKGFVELRVVNPDEQLALYEEDFRYDPAPSITGIEPSCVSTEGGAVITILGADLAHGCAVRIDGALVPSSWAHAGRIEAVAKKHDAGEVDLAVENPDTQRAVRPRALRFASPPRIDALAPDTGVTGGGFEVTLTGAGFEPGAAVLVAGAAAPGVTFVSATELRFPAPPHAATEAVEIGVVNPSGLGQRRAQAFTYVRAAPQVTSIAPATGPSAGGTELTVRGHDLAEGAAVFVCGIAARVTWKSRDELAVITPPVARDGLVDVRVVNPDDQSSTVEKAFRYVAALPPPQLRQVGPASGSQLGGLEVALLGEDFAEGVVASFGGVPATVRFLTGKELAVTTPAFTGYGQIAVEVVNPDGQACVLEAAFTYEPRPAPEITGITPTSGPATGGTRVVVEGKGFTRECAVYVGREYPKDLVFKSATELHLVTAARKQPGVVDVEVALPGAPRAVMKNGFRYDAMPAPIITSVSPNAGTPGGGTEMTISGKNFVKETVVLVDGKPPKGVKLVDASTLELKTPPGDPGKMVDVAVKNPDGKEAVQKRAFLYDPRYRG